MPETKTIKDDPAAVLRALADGHRVRMVEWPDNQFIWLHDKYIRNQDGGGRDWYLNGTWHVVPKRDMGADPKVGDMYSSVDRRRVVAITFNHVFVESENGFWGTGYKHEDWRGFFVSGRFVPVEYADA